MANVVGIDLGTTNSLFAYVKDGVPVVIGGEGGDPLVPSIVSLGDDGTIYVGREAQRRLLTGPGRLLGEALHGPRRRGCAARRGDAAVPRQRRGRRCGPDRDWRARVHAP